MIPREDELGSDGMRQVGVSLGKAMLGAMIDATRNHSQILRGASPRATLSVTAVARAVAQLRGRDYVTPRDVQEVFLRIIGHRLLLTPRAEAEGVDVQDILRGILEAVPAPVLR